MNIYHCPKNEAWKYNYTKINKSPASSTLKSTEGRESKHVTYQKKAEMCLLGVWGSKHGLLSKAYLFSQEKSSLVLQLCANLVLWFNSCGFWGKLLHFSWASAPSYKREKIIPLWKDSGRNNDSCNVKDTLFYRTWHTATWVSEGWMGPVCKGMWIHAHGNREGKSEWTLCWRKALADTGSRIRWVLH